MEQQSNQANDAERNGAIRFDPSSQIPKAGRIKLQALKCVFEVDTLGPMQHLRQPSPHRGRAKQIRGLAFRFNLAPQFDRHKNSSLLTLFIGDVLNVTGCREISVRPFEISPTEAPAQSSAPARTT